MSYTAPYIDSTGIHIPSYSDIIDNLVSSFKSIYGDDIYLGSDSQDYQMISIFALMLYDSFQFLETVFNAYSVKTAEGTALDSLLKLNGLKRKQASYSTVDLTLSGTAGTIIRNGRVADLSNRIWELDNDVTIGEDGTAVVSSTCEEIGAISAEPNTIINIMTPQRGWTGVTNLTAATEGDPIETDAELKLRQSLSVAVPSLNMVESLYSSIMALDNVKTCKIYDNDTHQTDINGIPPHSFSCVVEGGNASEIASVIYQKKGGGAGTYGTTTETITTSTGMTNDIKFFRPTELSVDVSFSIMRTNKYTSDTEQKIRDSIADYFDNITIGADVLRSSIIAIVSRVISDPYEPEFRINLPILTGKTGDELLDADTDIPFNQRAILGNLTITGGLNG